MSTININLKPIPLLTQSKPKASLPFVSIEGIDEQAAELLVRAGKVDSKEKLASSDPQELFNAINKGIKEGLVNVPKDYTLTLDDVKRWIESAKRKT
jgi:hypothetical protein